MKNITEPIRYCDTLQEITPEFLRSLEVSCVLIDMDNTLVLYKKEDLVPGARDWVEKLRQAGFECLLFTNARPGRTKKVAQTLGIPCVAAAGKPWCIAFWKASHYLSYPKEKWIVVGDQIFTDVLGANCYGIPCIYVKPAGSAEWGWTRMIRILERKLLRSKAR